MGSEPESEGPQKTSWTQPEVNSRFYYLWFSTTKVFDTKDKPHSWSGGFTVFFTWVKSGHWNWHIKAWLGTQAQMTRSEADKDNQVAANDSIGWTSYAVEPRYLKACPYSSSIPIKNTLCSELPLWELRIMILYWYGFPVNYLFAKIKVKYSSFFFKLGLF